MTLIYLLLISSYLRKWSHNQVLTMPEMGWGNIKAQTHTDKSYTTLVSLIIISTHSSPTIEEFRDKDLGDKS